VTVFEADAAPGGMIRTVHRDGWLFETGAGTVTVTPTSRAVLELAGPLPGVTVPRAGSQRRFLVHAGRVVAVPASPAELVATPLLSLAGRMRFLKEPFVPRGEPAPEESVAAFARRRFGEEGAGRFFDPLVSGTTGGDPEQLLAQYTFPAEVEFERRSGSVLKGRLRAARTARREGHAPADSAPWSCAAGLEALPQHLAAALGEACRNGVRVTSVEVHAGSVELGDAQGGLHRADGVVLALPAPALGQVAIEAPESSAMPLVSSMPHASLVIAALGFRRDQVAHPLDGHGLLAASSERRRILGVLFSSSQFPDRAPAGHVLLTVSLGGARHPAVVSLDDDAVLELVMAELGQLLGVSGAPVAVEIQRWPAALPLAMAGHAERLAVTDRIEAASGRLAFVGTWRDGLMLRDVMQGGVAAADRLIPRL
jgi:oxygen-dependent protoporphyrinogen oxidase